MQLSTLPRPGLAAALLALPLAAHAAFDGDFALTDAANPAGFYTVASFDEETDSMLGNWSVGFFPSEGGNSFIDTTLAPNSFTFGSATPFTVGFASSETVMIVEIPLDGYIAFTVSTCNSGEGDAAYSGFEFILSGEDHYSVTGITDAELTTEFIIQVAAGQTLEFRSYSLSGDESHASNLTTISDFLFSTSAIPEPAAFGALVGLAALGLAGRRRRPAEALA